MATSGTAALRDLFRSRDYRLLLATRVFAQSGDGSFQVCLAGLFFFSPQRATTPAGVAWALTASLLPYTIIGPFAGVLLDRWYRRQVLMVANAIRAVLVVIAAGLVYGSNVSVALLIVVLACLSVDRFVLAGLGASLPHVVQARRLVLANSITPTLGTISSVLGAATALVLSRAMGADDEAAALTMALPVALYVSSGVAVSRLARERLGPDGGPVKARIRDQLIDLAVGLGHGARHLFTRPAARDAMVLTGVIRTGFGAFAIVTILLCRNTFSTDVGSGLALVGFVAGLGGAGAGLAAVVVPIAARHLGLRGLVGVGLLVMAVLYLGFATLMSKELLLLGALPLGLAVQSVKIAVDTTVQTTIEENYLGRAFSLYDMVFNASLVLAAVVTVLIVPPSGLSPTLWVGFALVALAGLPLIRRLQAR